MSDVKRARNDADDGAVRPRRRFRRIARGLALAVALVIGTLLAATLATARFGDAALWPPAPGAATVEIFVVSHGYHAGVVLPRRALAEEGSRRGLAALGVLATRFADFERLEIGWGDEAFYRQVPTVGSVTAALALRALLRPGNPSVVHVVGVTGHPRTAFPHSDLVRLKLSPAGFARLADKLDASFARDGDGRVREPIGRGVYGTSLFFHATGTFHLFHVCNHWTADLLDAAGVPTAPVVATLPAGLLLDLEWRSGLEPLPRPDAPLL
jgi:uncharacterized protein (TIGR02117 family)